MINSIISNPILEKLPPHLLQYVLPQQYERYSAMNQATWRYVMHKNVDYLQKVAHSSYLSGLEITGISIEKIPSMYGMNRILKDIGWAAVAVDGLIPTAAFLEFQAYNVLVIASDIRQLENIEYTPTPDIIHESAGHAPIIANPEYAEYLRRIGGIGCKAISSHAENALFDAVRVLSQIKEKEGAATEKIEAAQMEVDRCQANMGPPSEMSHIKNLHWWTVEYGLIGDIKEPKIYGAGLLSSIGESKWCMSEEVKKLPYDISAAYQSFDVTRPQPQLYVTPDFGHLSYVLEKYANQMAIRTGGLRSIEKLIESKKLGTVELSTGLQISGTFDRVLAHDNKAVFIHCKGPTALSSRDKELIGHSAKDHPDGFGSPLGKLQGINLAIEDMSPRDLEAYDIYEERVVELEFEGGIKLRGQVVTGTRNLKGKILLITFRNCLITHKGKAIFEPTEGLYHLAVGKEIISAYAGPADHTSFDLLDHIQTEDFPIVHSDEYKLLNSLYQKVGEMRMSEAIDSNKLYEVFIEASSYPNQWLLILEIYELSLSNNFSFTIECVDQLEKIGINFPELEGLISSGMALINALKEREIN